MALSTLPEYSLETAARIAEAAQHRFQGEHSGILEEVRLAVVSTLRNPDDIVEFLSHARGCLEAAQMYRARGDMYGLTGEYELWQLFQAWGDTLVCHAMDAFAELPVSTEIMKDVQGVYGHLPCIRWRSRKWMADLSIRIALELADGDARVNADDVATSEARTYVHLCDFLLAIRAFHGAAAIFRKQGDRLKADRHFSIAQQLIDKAAETYGWLLVDAVADIPKH